MFDDIYEKIVKNKDNHNKGYYNCIPFIGLERLEKYLPGIEQASYFLVTASSGVGKSKLSRYLFMHSPMMFLKADKEINPNSELKLNVLYFSLEESKEKVILSEISKYLHTKYKLSISVKELSSVGRYNTISEDVLLKVKEAKEYVNEFLSNVTIYDNIRNATGIYKTVRDFALTIGTYYDKNNVKLTPIEITNIVKGIGEDYKKVSYYKKHNDKHFVIVLIDHISLLQPEQGENLHQAISKMSSNYCLHIRDKFGFTPVVVQQQSAAKEAVETNYLGKTIEEKLEPSLDGLGDNKLTQRDVNIAIGLFAPDRYKIETHNGYNIMKLKDNYRSLNILKSRDGVSNKKLPLFFNGAVDYFKEMPKSDDENLINQVYKLIETLNNK